MFVEVRLISASQALALKDSIVAAYLAAFSLPPYSKTFAEAQDFAFRFPRHVAREDFRCLVAQEARNSPVLGFAYGYACREGQWWRDQVYPALQPAARAEWLSDALEFVELAVVPEAQGRGLGRKLHNSLLEGVPHRTAVLSTLQAETTGLILYRQHGWITLLEKFRFPGVIQPYLILGKHLNPAP